ncbi:MAG: hypothetical protein ACI39H_03695 [Lachnospiraceae bacterium]
MKKIKQAALLFWLAFIYAAGVWMLLLRLMGQQIEQVNRPLGCALLACLAILFWLLFTHQKNISSHGKTAEQQG